MGVLTVAREGTRGSESRIPGVFITAYDDHATRIDAPGVGCVDCLQKPFAAERLIQALERGMKS